MTNGVEATSLTWWHMKCTYVHILAYYILGLKSMHKTKLSILVIHGDEWHVEMAISSHLASHASYHKGYDNLHVAKMPPLA